VPLPAAHNGRSVVAALREAPMLFKLITILMLLAILVSLFSSLFFMNRDHGKGRRTVRALTTRVALSLALFGLLFLAYHFGWMAHGT
jgi:hypothetical protein